MADEPTPDPDLLPPDTPAGADPPGRVAAARARAEELKRRARDRFDRERHQRSWVETVWRALVRMHHRGGPLLSGGLAYRIFLWEVPAALFVVAVLGLFKDVGGYNPDQMAHDAGLGAALTAAIGQAVAQTDTSSWWLLLLGAGLMVIAGRSAAGSLRLICRIAWNQRAIPKAGRFAPALAFTGVMFAAMALSYAGNRMILDGLVKSILGWLLVLAVNLVFVTFAMTLLPRAGRPWPVVIPGAVLFTVVIRAMVIASGVYFADKMDRVDDLYGSLGIAIVLLLWLYLLAWGWIAATFINAGLAGIGGDDDAILKPAPEPEGGTGALAPDGPAR